MSDLHCRSGPYFSENTALVVAIPEYSRIIRCTEYSPYTVQCNYDQRQWTYYIQYAQFLFILDWQLALQTFYKGRVHASIQAPPHARKQLNKQQLLNMHPHCV